MITMPACPICGRDGVVEVRRDAPATIPQLVEYGPQAGNYIQIVNPNQLGTVTHEDGRECQVLDVRPLFAEATR